MSTLLDNPGDSRFWTVPPGLQIRVWNLPDILRSLSDFNVNIERFLKTSVWYIMPQVFFAQMTSYTVQYDIIYHPFPINSQYLKTWRVDSPAP